MNLLCATALCLIASPAFAETTIPDQADHSAAKSPSLTLAGEVYSLEFIGGDVISGSVNEYIPNGETLDRWSSMVAVRHHPNMKDPKVAAVDLVRALKAKNPQAPSKLFMNNDDGSVSVDFITWQGDEIAEFNIFIYRNSPDGDGLVSHQFAKRAYADEMRPFLRSLKDARMPILREVLTFRFPEVVKPQH